MCIKRLRIILLDSNRQRSAILRQALHDSGHEVLLRTDDLQALKSSSEMNHADMIIVSTEIPTEPVFEHLKTINETKPKPIVFFTQKSSFEMGEQAIQSGISAYIVEGLAAERVQPIIDIAIARFREFMALRDELDFVKDKLSQRKYIEKAKGILCEKQNLTEEQAYSRLRSTAMKNNLTIGEVAKNILTLSDIIL